MYSHPDLPAWWSCTFLSSSGSSHIFDCLPSSQEKNYILKVASERFNPLYLCKAKFPICYWIPPTKDWSCGDCDPKQAYLKVISGSTFFRLNKFRVQVLKWNLKLFLFQTSNPGQNLILPSECHFPFLCSVTSTQWQHWHAYHFFLVLRLAEWVCIVQARCQEHSEKLPPVNISCTLLNSIEDKSSKYVSEYQLLANVSGLIAVAIGSWS